MTTTQADASGKEANIMRSTDHKLETLAHGGAFFESPRWHEGRLWVSDFWTFQVLAVSPDGTTEAVAEVPGSPSGLGWLPDGTLLVVSMRERRLLRVDGGATVLHADLSAYAGPECNDMVVDTAGRAYVGTIDFMAFADMPVTNLVRVDPDGSATVAADGLSFPNGSVITPDGSSLIVAESWAQRLTAFDLQPDGSLANRRVWAELGAGCAPDGIALDAEGAVWVADAGSKRAIRVREGGGILDEISAAGLDVIACALGGDDGRTLFLCTTPDFRLMPDEAARTGQRASSPAAWTYHTRACRDIVGGRGEPRPPTHLVHAVHAHAAAGDVVPPIRPVCCREPEHYRTSDVEQVRRVIEAAMEWHRSLGMAVYEGVGEDESCSGVSTGRARPTANTSRGREARCATLSASGSGARRRGSSQAPGPAWAHRDRRPLATMPTFIDLNEAIDHLGELSGKCELLLHWADRLPMHVVLGDVMDAFSVPWVPAKPRLPRPAPSGTPGPDAQLSCR